MSPVTRLAFYRDEFCGLLIWEISDLSTGLKSKKHDQNGGLTCIVRDCRSFVDACNFTNKANSHTCKVETHARQKLCHFGRYVSKAKLFCLKRFVLVTRAGVFSR